MTQPGLKKLTITRCTVQENGDVRVGSDRYEVLINPASYSHQRAISYDQKRTFGQLAPTARFSAIEGEDVSFEIVMDGTGVVPGQSQDVKSQMQSLSSIVYEYDGNEHEPSVVRLLWGSLIFFGRLKSMAIEYTLFKSTGDPLRAKVKLGFVGFMSKEEEALRANRSSPDLTHVVEVRAGDTLPLLCYRIYKDPSYYPEVARVNGLSDFRVLEPGTRLEFPPLESRSGSGTRRGPARPIEPGRRQSLTAS